LTPLNRQGKVIKTVSVVRRQ